MPQLDSRPALAPLYVKAAVTGPLHRGGVLPASSYALPDQSIDPAHLVAYQQVCDFRVGDVLPPTYLHVLAFPLSVALMTEGGFPFPLIGLVHVENEITVHRPVLASETVSFEVHAENLRPHPAGQAFDIVAQATAAGETVWTGRSGYLRRGASPDGSSSRAERGPRAELEPQRGPVAMVRAPGDIGRRYAAVSGDRNPIHLHPLTAKAFGFPTAIGHGMWLLGRVLASLEGRLPEASRIEVSFKTPVLLPSTVAVATPPADGGWDLDVRAAKSGKPHLAGTVRPL